MKTKPCRFILLPSKEKALEGDIIKVIETGKLSISAIDNNWNPKMELILISLDPDEKIDIGDTVLTPNNYVTKVYGKLGELLECSGDGDYDKSELKKVIATQKQILTINQFIKDYNKGEVKDVNIDIEEIEVY